MSQKPIKEKSAPKPTNEKSTPKPTKEHIFPKFTDVEEAMPNIDERGYVIGPLFYTIDRKCADFLLNIRRPNTYLYHFFTHRLHDNLKAHSKLLFPAFINALIQTTQQPLLGKRSSKYTNAWHYKVQTQYDEDIFDNTIIKFGNVYDSYCRFNDKEADWEEEYKFLMDCGYIVMCLLYHDMEEYKLYISQLTTRRLLKQQNNDPRIGSMIDAYLKK